MTARPTALINVREQGSGRPLVLIHGAGTSIEIWRRVMPRLARRRRAIAVDLPGYGASAPAGIGFSLQRVAERVLDGLDERGVEPPYDLVGHSLGGALALTLAAHHPARLARLVLVAPAGLAAVPSPLAPLLALGAGPFARVRRVLATPLVELPLARRLALAGVARNGARVPAEDARAVIACSRDASRLGAGLLAAARADLRTELAALEVPVGFVWGAQDPVVPPARLARALAARPDAPVRIIEDAAHAPMLEQPEAFCDALEAVLARLRPRAGSRGGRRGSPASATR